MKIRDIQYTGQSLKEAEALLERLIRFRDAYKEWRTYADNTTELWFDDGWKDVIWWKVREDMIPRVKAWVEVLKQQEEWILNVLNKI